VVFGKNIIKINLCYDEESLIQCGTHNLTIKGGHAFHPNQNFLHIKKKIG